RQKQLGVLRQVHALSQHALHGFEHAGGLERLHHEVLRTRLDRFHHQRLLPHGAAHEDLGVRVQSHDLAHGVDATHVRHHDVHRDEVGLELLVLGDRLHPALRLAKYKELKPEDRKSTRLNSSHQIISYAVFCLKKKDHRHDR